MQVAYIFVKATPGHDKKVFKELQENAEDFGILDMHPVRGKYDIILKIEHKDDKDISKAVKEIKKIKDIGPVSVNMAVKF